MKQAFCLCIFALLAFSLSAESIAPRGTRISPTDPNIRYVGRVSHQNPESPMFAFPGVQIISGFTGTSLRMIAKPLSGYFMAQIDGHEAFKVGFNAERDSVVSLASALAPGQHEVRLMYVTEGYDRRAEFRGFLLDDGCQLLPVQLPERRMEFIGNSITCGYGVEDNDRDSHYQDETCNHYFTYAALTARALNAQHQVVARSGMGVYRNYNGPITGDSINMNTEYLHTLLYDPSQLWDFTRYQPDVVCVNLGTNDTSTTGADPALLRKGYQDLYTKIRSAYAKAKIVFLSGPMMSGNDLSTAQTAMNQIVAEAQRQGDQQVYRFDLTPQDGSLGYGADWHPSMAQQQKSATELTAFLRELMGW